VKVAFNAMLGSVIQRRRRDSASKRLARRRRKVSGQVALKGYSGAESADGRTRDNTGDDKHRPKQYAGAPKAHGYS